MHIHTVHTYLYVQTTYIIIHTNMHLQLLTVPATGNVKMKRVRMHLTSVQGGSPGPQYPRNNVNVSKSVKILYYNARSLLYKYDDLIAECSFYSPDIICITETWLCSDIIDSEIFIDGYCLVRLDRDRHGGGIIMYVNSSLSFSILSQVPELEFLAISISSIFGKFCVALAYRPPSTSSIHYFNSLNCILSGLNTNLHKYFVFLGDLNTDTSHNTFSSSDLSATLELFGLHLVPTGPTRVTDTTSTTLDIIATSAPDNVLNCSVVSNLGTSDHFSLFTTISCSPILHSRNSVPRLIWRYNLADFNLANDLLLNLDPASIIVPNDINASWINFNNAFLAIMEQCIPHSKISPKKIDLGYLKA